MSTCAFPSDAVAKGATEIQGTTFAPVQADYEEMYYSVARRRAESMMAQVGGKALPEYFPTTESAASSWRFFGRQDMSTSSRQANLIGIQGRESNLSLGYFSVAESKDVNKSLILVSQRIVNWIFSTITLANSDVIPVPHRKSDVSATFIVDPETSLVLDGSSDESAIAMLETLGFLWTPQAADYPLWTPFNRLVSGSKPLG
jgi:hypothetical protein